MVPGQSHAIKFKLIQVKINNNESVYMHYKWLKRSIIISHQGSIRGLWKQHVCMCLHVRALWLTYVEQVLPHQTDTLKYCYTVSGFTRTASSSAVRISASDHTVTLVRNFRLRTVTHTTPLVSFVLTLMVSRGFSPKPLLSLVFWLKRVNMWLCSRRCTWTHQWLDSFNFQVVQTLSPHLNLVVICKCIFF